MSQKRPGRNLLSFRLGFPLLIVLLLLGSLNVSPASSAPQPQGTAPARQFQTGDIVVTIDNGDILWYDGGGKFIRTIFSGSSSFLSGLAFNPSEQLLYATDQSNGIVNRFTISANWAGTFGPGYEEPTSILFDRFDNVYVGQITDVFEPLFKLEQGGSLADVYSLDSSNYGVMTMALASDQCTLYYTSWVEEGQTVKRFNLCTNSPITPDLSNGLNSSEAAIGLQILPDGSLLVANGDDVRRINAFTGNFIRAYDFGNEGSWFAVSVSPDGKTFWGTSGTRVYQFDVETGQNYANFETGGNTSFSQTNSISSITVIGEYRAALPTATFTPTITRTSTFTNTPTNTTTYTPTNTSTPTRTPTGTRTEIPTDTPTDTPTETPAFLPTDTPIPPAEDDYIPPYVPPQPPEFPWWIVIIGGGGIAAVGTYLAVRALKPKPRAPQKAGPHQTRVMFKVREDPGRQTVESDSNASLPQLRLRFEEGQAEYFVEEHKPKQGDGDAR